MPMYKTLVTSVGRQKIAAAALNGKKVNITQAAVGDGGGAYYLPDADVTALVGEKWRGDIAGKWINEQSANMIDVMIMLPADVGGFTVREAALIDEGGDLIVICNLPDTEKAVITTGAAGTLTILMHIVLTDVETVEIKIDPNLDTVTAADVERMIKRHEEDLNAHMVKCHVIATRTREAGKPGYGLGGGGDAGVVLKTGPYTGEAEIGVVVSGTEYDAENLSAETETVENGTIIVKKLEE